MLNAQSWPFVQARAILNKINHKIPQKGYVLFETGYGPSGLPHIGTFGEVVRTIMIQNAFKQISDIPTRLICFSDDMDGLRKIPENIPSEYKKYIGLPLSNIPDPFGIHESYASNMNHRLCKFLDQFEFEYEFISATHCYRTGVFNELLMRVLEKYDEIMNLMLPTLGTERQNTYSPFLPICPQTGKVLQVPIISRDIANGTISYQDDMQNIITVQVTNGNCKLQWKPDFGMRWAAFNVDFEMFGKDVGINAKLYSQICNILNSDAPTQMIYEMFLDEDGKKISKSKGTGVTIDEWLKYGPVESLKLFMFVAPQKAKKLSFEIIPRYVDDLITYIKQYINIPEKQFDNPIYHIKQDNFNEKDFKIIANSDITYSLILNLASACNADDTVILWKFIDQYALLNDKYSLIQCNFFKRMINNVLNYYKDFIKPLKQYLIPNDQQKQLINILKDFLLQCDDNTSIDIIQNTLYKIARDNEMEIKDWFKLLYSVLIGQDNGPRFGSFIKLYGISNTVELINSKLNFAL